MSTEDNRDVVREWVAASRRKQGLPPTITDPVVLDRVADILRAADPEAAKRRGGGRQAA